jgi:putative peptide zinc metalloprotease protein
VTTPLSSTGPTPELASGVELLGELEGSGYRQTPSLVRRADGQVLQVTPLLARLLQHVDGRRDVEALATAFGDDLGRPVTAGDVEQLLEKAAPLGVLAGSAVDAAPKANPLLALRFKVVLTDPDVTRRVTTPFAQLLRPWVVVPVLVAFAWVSWWVLAERGLAGAARQALYEPHLLLAVVGLTVLSAGFHELGHAAACRYGGARPGAMGAGLYLVWPAFYTDVDDCLRLSRWGRLRVDLAGLYFNAVFAVAVAGLWLLWREDALLLGVAAQLVQMVRQLAPFIRADGYHILSDLTGVPDLFSHIGPTLRGLLPWRRERSPLAPWARVVVAVWVLVTVPLLLGLLALTVWLLPRLVATAWDALDGQGGSLADDLASGDVVTGAARLLSLLGLLLPAAAAVLLVGRVLQRTWRRVLLSTEDRPVRRTAASVAAVLVMALVAWAWWPQGQYRPVEADERGTLPGLSRVVDAAPADGTRSALALVPRDDPSAPVLLLVEGSDGPQALLTARDGGPARVVPFRLPDQPGAGDNQSLAVNTTDGSVLYDVAFAMVRVTDGAPVTSVNEAWALASCSRCTTAAVAFQVVLVVGSSHTVAPVNAAVAGNRDCLECVTTALATQLVVTLSALPGPEVEAQLAQAWERLGDAERALLTGDLDLAGLQAQVVAVRDDVVRVLADAGLVDAALLDGAPLVTGTPAPSASTTAGPSASPTATTPPSSDGTSPGATPTASGDPAGATAGPTSAPPSAPSAAPTSAPAQEPTPAPTGG